jgi:hypothetical protein
MGNGGPRWYTQPMRAPGLVLPLFAAAAAAQAPPARVLVVDPTGAAHAEATAVVGSLPDAADWHAANAPEQPLTVRLTAGHHEVARTARFANARGLVVEATPGAELRGGLRLDAPDWQPCDTEFAARLPESTRPHARALRLPAARLRTFAHGPNGLAGPGPSGHSVPVRPGGSEVFVGGRALRLARWPNEGLAKIGKVIDGGSVPRDSADDVPVARRKHEPPRGAVFAVDDVARVARWPADGGFHANGFWHWDWSDEQIAVAKADAATGTITLAAPHTYGVAAHGRFYVVDLPEELDAEGECWIDRPRGVVLAWLPEGGEHEPVEVSLLAEPMLILENCRDTVVRGVTFGSSRGETVAVRGADGLLIEHCSFARSGTRALTIDGHDVHVRHSSFADVGGTGIDLTGGDRRTLVPSGSSIEDCTFVRCGRVLRTYQPCIHLHGVGHRVLHNELAYHPHIALVFEGNDHLIAANFVHDVVLETGDAGAVYTGRDWTSHGNRIEGNVFADVPGNDARYQNGVYLDDMASGITVADNLFVRCNWGLLVGGGRDLVLRGNAFAACGRAMHYDARGVGWMHKEILDPETSTLRRRLAAMPIGEEPWQSRFPTLREYLTDRFGRPVNGLVAGTLLLGTPPGSIDDRECVREEGTTTAKIDGAALASACDRWLAAVRRQRIDIGEFTIGPVGPRP